jgi:hypothetical protein
MIKGKKEEKTSDQIMNYPQLLENGHKRVFIEI